MPTTIKLKNSVTTTNAPSSLAQGEVAINITDKKVWVGNAATTPIQLLGAGGSASFGALSCTSLTNSGLTSGRVTYSTVGGLATDSANLVFTGTAFNVVGTVNAVAASTQDGVSLAGRAGGTSSYVATVTPTTLSANRTITLPDSNTSIPIATQFLTFSGPSAARTITFPDADTTVVGTTATQTLTNKTVTARVSSTASISSPLAWNSDNFDQYAATAQAGALTINADAGTPTDGRKIVFCITSDATPRVITFTGGASKAFKPVGVSLTTSGSNFTYTLTASKTTYFGAIYNSGSSRWEILAVAQEA
jgi:hypothetical protein